jgi:hypothetical protein
MSGRLGGVAGYSGTPLAKKLGVKEGSTLALLDPPEGFAIDDLPDGVEVTNRPSGHVDVIVFFTTRRADLERAIDGLGTAIFPAGAAWVAWPKKAAKVATDMTEDVVRDVALPLGLVDVKVCAIDDTWSGLKLVWRKERR